MQKESESPDFEVQAHFKTPSLAILRLVGEEVEEGEWVERVELVEPEPGSVIQNGRVKEGDKAVITISESRGLEATQIYNSMVEPLITAELEAAKELRDEAKAQGDTITFFAQNEYIEELEENREL